jgi:2-alkyl-3-oxoalkanoate reductase
VKVLLTGATGMLGRSTAELLIGRGDEVSVLQRRPSRLPCRELLGDIADREVVRRATRGQEAVVHLAAKVDVTGRWPEYVRANIEGTRSVLGACRAEHVSRLVHASSPSVAHAGKALVAVTAEPADPLAARGHYSRSKAVAELEALAADSAALSVLVVRPHLVWGPGDTQLVEPVVERARAGRLPIIGHGATLIDTTYIDNAAAAMVAALDACGRVHGESLVVSNGEPRPLREIMARLCAAAGAPAPTMRVPFPAAWLAGAAAEAAFAVSRSRSAPRLTRFVAEQMATAHWFDQRRTRAALQWSPSVSLDDGFARLAAWYAASAA